MPTYAILGATGQTGSEIVKALLPTSAHLNIYARSRSRLEKKFPSISTAVNVSLFIGDLSDTSLLASCLSSADVIFSTVAQNRNEPGCSIAQQTAFAIVQALEPQRKSGVKIPYVVFLSSGSVDPNNPHQRETGYQFMYNWVLYHIYEDLRKAIKHLQDKAWIPLIVASAGAIVHDPAEHAVELTDDPLKASQIESYADLAKGMIAMGDAGDKWKGKYVSMKVNEGRPIDGNPIALLRYLLPNLLASICPPLWRLGKGYWPA